ncbi:DNA-directed RNA polymerase III subunit RPC3, partial [Phenoliferia sp. Uapishka_3]
MGPSVCVRAAATRPTLAPVRATLKHGKFGPQSSHRHPVVERESPRHSISFKATPEANNGMLTLFGSPTVRLASTSARQRVSPRPVIPPEIINQKRPDSESQEDHDDFIPAPLSKHSLSLVYTFTTPPPISAISALASRLALSTRDKSSHHSHSLSNSLPLLEQALIHPSFWTGVSTLPSPPNGTTRTFTLYHDAQKSHNASLSALGNALLGTFASELILSNFPTLPTRVVEAACTKYVGPKSLAAVAGAWGVAPSRLERSLVGTGPEEDEKRMKRSEKAYGHLVGGRGGARKPERSAEEGSAGAGLVRWNRKSRSVTEDDILFEDSLASVSRAIVGAIYQVHGFAATRNFVHSHFLSRLLPSPSSPLAPPTAISDITPLLKFDNPTLSLTHALRKLAPELSSRPSHRLLKESGRMSSRATFLSGVFTNPPLNSQEVASLLLTRGSLPFTHLLRLSSLPPAQVHSALLILSLHSLLYHSENESSGKLIELYEINDVAIERRIRGGVFVELAREEGDGQGLEVAVEGIWREGMRKKEEIVEEVSRGLWEKARTKIEEEEFGSMDWDDQDGFGGATNGNGKSKGKGTAKGKSKAGITSLADAKVAANKMVARSVRDGFLSIVTPGSQISPMALEIKWEEELRLSIKGLPSNKELKDLKETLKNKKREWLAEEKERAEGRGYGMEKRKRTRHRGIDLNLDTEEEALPKLPLIYEYGRFRYNTEVAEVLKAILSIAEKEVEGMDEGLSAPIAVNEIFTVLNSLPNPPDLSRCFPSKTPNPAWKTPKGTAEVVSEICKVLGCEDDFNFGHGRAFLKSAGGDGVMAKWQVEYGPLGAGMKRALVEALILDKEGVTAMRCWRILEAKGKLEEKHLARLAFLPVKDAREVLGRLSSTALIEQQEVPRSADRAPSRTFFLWYVDYPKVVASLLDHQYKALANIQAQKMFQLQAYKGLVEKRERSDVRADPEGLLTNADRENAARLDEKLEALTTAEMRIDRDIFVLKELDSW